MFSLVLPLAVYFEINACSFRDTRIDPFRYEEKLDDTAVFESQALPLANPLRRPGRATPESDQDPLELWFSRSFPRYSHFLCKGYGKGLDIGQRQQVGHEPFHISRSQV